MKPRGRVILKRRGFTLLEMILVLAVAVLMMGVAAAALMRSESDTARARRGMAEAVMHLRAARADAMVTRSLVEVVLESTDALRARGEMLMRRIEWGAGSEDGIGGGGAAGAAGGAWAARPIEAGNLGLVDAQGGWTDALRVRFDSSGRCDSRGWRFVERTGSRSGRIAWVIGFDPVSGEARLWEGDGSIAGVESWGDRADDRAPREQGR